MKKIALLMSLVLLLMAMPLTAYAEQPAAPYAASNPPATPYWKYTANMTSSLHYDKPIMTCVSTVSAFADVTSITVEQTLQKQGSFWSWSPYDNDSVWKTTVNTFWANIYNYKTVTESGTYRLKTVATVTNKDGKSETITIYSEELVI